MTNNKIVVRLEGGLVQDVWTEEDGKRIPFSGVLEVRDYDDDAVDDADDRWIEDEEGYRYFKTVWSRDE